MSKIRQSADLEVIARSGWRSFSQNENGAITVEFVVQTALVVSLGVIVGNSISSDVSGLAYKKAIFIGSSELAGATSGSGASGGPGAIGASDNPTAIGLPDGSGPSASPDGQASQEAKE